MSENKIQEIRDLIYRFGGIDGAHHKQWLLDQIIQKTCDSQNEYLDWIKQYEDGEDGPKTYEWDRGIVP